MFCPQCGAQAKHQTKFCKACGLKLTEHARLLADPQELERASAEERYLRKGTSALLGSVMAYLVYGLIFGTLAFFQPDLFHSDRLAGWLIWLPTPLLLGVLGIINLIRGGYFRNFRERQLRAAIEHLEQKRQNLQAGKTEQVPALTPSSHKHKVTSVTEHTTRELQPQPSNSGKIV